MLKRRKELLLLLPGMAGFLMFYVIPVGEVLKYAVVESAFSPAFVGFRNFAQVFQNVYFRLALQNTAWFSLLSIPLLLALSFVLALLLQRRSRAMQAILLIPVFVPSVALARLWPSLSEALTRGGTLSGSSQRIAILSIFLWKNMGIFVVLFLAALRSIPLSVKEAAAIDGAGTLRKLGSIYLPLILPHITFSAIYALVCSMRVFRESYLMFGSYPDKALYFIQHYMNNHFAKLNYQTLSAASLLFFLPVLLVFGLMLHLERKATEQIW